MPTRTDCLRPPVVRMVPLRKVMPGARVIVELGEKGLVMAASAPWASGTASSTRPRTTSTTLAVMVGWASFKGTDRASLNRVAPHMTR